MTEQVSAELTGSQSPGSEAVSNAPAPSNSEQHQARQPDIGNVIGYERRNAFEKGLAEGRQKALEELQRQPMQKTQASYPNQTVSPNISPTDIEQMINKKIQEIAEASQRQQREEWATKEASRFVQKIEEGKSKYPDFEEKVGPVIKDISTSMSGIIPTLNAYDNVADMLYEIANNPKHLAELALLPMAPNTISRSVAGLSASIKANEIARQQKQPKPPISQITPSNVGLGNNIGSVSEAMYDPICRA